MRNKRIASAMACCAAWIISAQPAAGGIVILSGDSTPAFSLTDTLPDPAVAGNRQFFANVLGAGTNVAVLASSYSGADSEINEFYSSLPGKASTLLAGTITSGQLVGQQLLVLPVPDHDFTSVEAACIQSFCAAGGSVFLLGEANATTFTFGPATDSSINGLLSLMSVPLSLTITDLDNGAHDAIGAKIISDPLTAGVTSYHYGATASVNGGTSLFLAMNDTPMVTYISETTPLCSLLLALSIVGAVVRPIPKTTCFNT